MKLLFEHNLSPALIRSLISFFPDSIHCSEIGLGNSDDIDIWNYTKENGYTIVTKDSDFNVINTLRGFPPYVIWIRRGNCSTQEIELLLRANQLLISSLSLQKEDGLLILF